MSRHAIAAICAVNDPPTLFARTEDNLRITRWGERVQPMDKALVTHLGEHHCDWLLRRGGNDLPARMPPHVADDMLTQAPWDNLPPLLRLVRSPVILPDARILAASGYDEGTGLYLALEPGFVLPEVPDEPTEEDCQLAARFVQSFLDEFVFASAADQHNALGLFIGHLLRPLLGDDALLPMFAIDAPIQSTGKTALANATGVLALGNPPKIVPEIKDADEWRKQVGALLAGENELVLFDNLTHKLDDASLAAVLTGEGLWGGRLLGGNDLVNERTKLTVIVTGNNLEVGADLRRRVIYIRMDTNLADPSSRQFRRTDFLGALKVARPRLLGAVFTWARRWLQLGSPVQGAPVLAGYNPFVRTVHGLLRLIGLEDWLGNLGRFRDSQDAEASAWAAWLVEWHRLWRSEPQTTGDLARALNSVQNDYLLFSERRPQELLVYSQIDRDKLATSLGFALKKRQDQVLGNLKLVRAAPRDGYTRWRVIPLDAVDGADEPAPGPAPHVEEISVPTGSVGVVGEVGEWGGVPPVPVKNTEKRSRARVRNTPTSPTTPTEIDGVLQAPARARTREVRPDPPSSIPRVCAHAVCSIDLETTGLRIWEGHKPRVVTIHTPQETLIIDLFEHPDAVVELRLLVSAERGPLITGHNLAFDLAMLDSVGVPPPPMARVFDTMLASQLLDQSADDRPPQGLDDLVKRYLGVDMDKTLQTSDWSAELTQEQLGYAANDAEMTFALAAVLRARIQDEGMTEALAIEHGFLPFLMALQQSGMPVDQDRWLGLEQHAIEQRLRLEARMEELYSGTPPERWTAKGWLEAYLEERGLVRERTTQGKPSLSKKALETLGHDPLIRAYLDWKPFEKRGSTWGTRFLRDNLAADGRFHGEYRQLGTRTGRLSCDRPNMQNIPRGPYREALRPSEGRCFVKADYSQLQLVIIADETLDPVMLAAYDPRVPHEARIDLHTVTARQVLGLNIPDGERVRGAQRIVCKNINFGLCYGMGLGKLAAMIERETGEQIDQDEARRRRNAYFRTYGGVKHWHDLGRHKSARGLDYDDEDNPNPIDVRIASGRRRSGVWKFGQKVNSPIQMREADGVKTGLALLLPRLAEFPTARVVMMIHDEVIIEPDVQDAVAVARIVATSLEEGMNRFLKHTTATVEVDIVQDYAGTPVSGL